MDANAVLDLYCNVAFTIGVLEKVYPKETAIPPLLALLGDTVPEAKPLIVLVLL